MVKTGLELIGKHLSSFKDKRIGLVINQASVNSKLQSTLQVFHKYKLNVTALFGPQHGLFGHTQDNMIEWEGDEYGIASINIFSLYGENRKPTPEMLSEIDLMVFDIQDVGSRYYTFIWTMALCMEAVMESNKEFIVLDRPNPIGGSQCEGPILNMDFQSFVGLYPLPVRHGLTIGEIALWLNKNYFSDVHLQVIEMEGWKRKMYFRETGLPWIMPSPNMPHLDTAIVYPGQCLLEATNISEGRGTTRPFEIFGAPWIDNEELCIYLTKNCNSAIFQPWYFEPTFHKYKGELCRGVFIHVVDKKTYKPLATSLTILSYLSKNYSSKFEFLDPPYEYEYDKFPFDILMGNSTWRYKLQKNIPFEKWTKVWESELSKWQLERSKILIY